MNNKILYLIFLLTSILKISGQENPVENGIFTNFNQFKSEKPCEIKSFYLKDKTDLLITIDNLESNCKGFKKTNKIIAIKYNNETYYNMRFNVEFMTKNRFSKLLVKGKYCAFLVDESYPINIQGQAGFNTGGLFGALILGPNGKNKIYYLDIDKGYKTKVLTTKRLKKLLEKDGKLLESFNNEKNINAELFLNYLGKLNKKFE
jgi:hypothetical protein|tara:strand:- start:27 stop:638 length:612 start_codon:yes stop_codon:yes gene_type:complete